MPNRGYEVPFRLVPPVWHVPCGSQASFDAQRGEMAMEIKLEDVGYLVGKDR